MSQLLNRGTVSQVEAALEKSNSRKNLRLALHNERENKNRVTVIRLLEEKLKV